MPRTIYNPLFETRTARLKLEQRKRPYWFRVAPGISLGYRRNEIGGSWNVRGTNDKGGTWIKSFATADDYQDSDGVKVLTYFEATRAAIEIGRQGPGQDGVVSVCLEQQIAMKVATFIRGGIEPACYLYLYRHYDPTGDLLYVGISLSPLRRHEKHFAKSEHRYWIVRILIEPFASREEALRAEARAIREEFPKFNTAHNRRQHPALELRQIERKEIENEPS
jgi:predicted GIY-YIG superfamily endonuclease